MSRGGIYYHQCLGGVTGSVTYEKKIQELIIHGTNSILAIVQLNKHSAVIGFLAAKDHPLLPSVHPSAWEHYIWTKYKTVDMTARNTLFIHLLCWEESYARELVDALLRSMFMHDSYLMYVAFIKSMAKYPLLKPGCNRCEGSFRRVTTSERGVPPETLPSLCVAERSEVCARLRVRRAVEEDNDDLVPIIDRHSSRLRELYGEFYVSELISRHPESERVLLVGEHKELAVGVMFLNTEINYEDLAENFELSPFAGLKHLDEEPKIGVQFTVPELSSANLFDSAVSTMAYWSDIMLDSAVPRENADPTKKTLSWVSKDTERRERLLGEIPVSLESIDKDEDVDFDIVNIDTDLLKVPRSLSVDMDVDFEIFGLPLLGKDTGSSSGLAERRRSSCRSLSMSVGDPRRYQKMAGEILQDAAKDNVQHSYEKKTEIKQKKVFNSDRMWRDPAPATETGPRFTGTPNAFLLEVFAMHPDYDERYGFDILQAAFELFPGRDYCVLCLPSNQSAFPLLEHFTLVVPKHYHEKYTNQSLYVAHVNSVREKVAVRRAEAFDFPAISRILEYVPTNHLIVQLLQRSFVSDLESYVLLSQNQPVGFIILGPLENDVAMRMHFDLETEAVRPGSDAAILAGILSPALEAHSRWYLRDILRQTKYTHLFWLCQLMAKTSYLSRNIMSLAGRMVPILPNRRTIPNITGVKDLDKMWNMPTPFALWGIEKCLTALPKVDVNNGIVVVGASRTGLAFIETLLMGPASHYLTFTNVTLVSEHGLPLVTDCLAAAETCVPRGGRHTDRYLKSIPFYFYVDCITGIMVGIDRPNKCIHLKGGGVKYYDELVLTCGQQFQHPNYLAESFADIKKMKTGLPCERMLMDNPKYHPDRVPSLPDLPDNVFVINSLYEANIYLRKLLRMINTSAVENRMSAANPVIVYGDCLQSYSTIAALLELGIKPEDIAFVEPFPPEDRHALRVNCFNNELIDERVQERIKELGIHVYRQCSFVGWRMKEPRIDQLEVMSPLQRIRIPCFAFFYYGLKALNFYAFKAISECGLVYDGGLVVDPSFKTNDPHVYGAGTFVQYSRRLHADRQSHRHYCSEDVGEALAKIFLSQMDPFVMADSTANSSDVLPRYKSSVLSHFIHPSIERLTRPSLEKHRKWEPVIEFESPIMYWATLPGPLYYLRVRKPGADIPMEVQLALPHQGHLLSTDKDGNYFALRLNHLHCIESITCLAKKPPQYGLLTQIYGVHEAMFNHLLSRYMMKKIEDLYEYFMQSWMSPLYQDSFGTLLRQICQQNVGTVYDLAKSHFALEPNVELDIDTESVNSYHESEGLVNSESYYSGTSRSLSCYSRPSCMYGVEDAPNLGAVNSVIDRFIRGHLFTEECGQSEKLRNEAKSFWSAVGGDRITTAHLARYLDHNRVPNPHFAKIKPNLL